VCDVGKECMIGTNFQETKDISQR